MDKRKIFEILEIEETKDEDLLKAAYRSKLVKTNPEDDPEGFVLLRQAYEEAVRLVHENEDGKEKNEVDLWIDKARKIYGSISARVSLDRWKELLEEEVCVALDTEAEAREKLLVMVMECCNLPHNVWELFDEQFGYKDDYESLCELFPKNYVDFIVNQTKFEGFIDFELFTGDDEGDVDELVNLIYRIKEIVEDIENDIEDLGEDIDRDRLNGRMSEAEQLIKQAKGLGVGHPYVDVMQMKIHGIRGEFDEAQEILEQLRDGFSDVNGKEFMDNVYVRYNVSDILEHTGHEDEAYELRRQVLEEIPFHRQAMMADIRYYFDKENYSKAKDVSIEFLDRYGNYPDVLDYMRRANEKIMEDYKVRADNGEIDAIYELGWCYFQNEMYDDCIGLIEQYKPDAGDDYEFEFMNLTGRCFVAKGDYVRALERLRIWRDILYGLVDDGSEKYKRRIKRKGYSNYVIGMCLYNMWEKGGKGELPQEIIECITTAIDVEEEFKERIYYQDRLAMIYNETEQYRECIDVCTHLLEEVPQYYMAYVFRQEAYCELDYPQNVMEDFYEGIKYYDKDSKIYENALKALFEYRQLEEATSVIEMAHNNGVESDMLNFLTVKIAWKKALENDEERDEILTKCLKTLLNMKSLYIDRNGETDIKDKADILYTIGLIYLDLRDRKNGFRYLQKTITLDAGREELVYWIYANLYSADNDYKNELKYMRKIFKLNRNNVEVRFRLGKCYWNMDENEKAKAEFDKVYRLNPQHQLVNSYLNDYYFMVYRETYDEAMWEKALFHAQKQYERERCAYYKIKLGQLYWEIYDVEKTYEIFKSLKEEDENIIDADYYLAHLALLEWDSQKAYDILKKAIELDTETVCINDYMIYKTMMDVCMSMRRFDEAMKYVRLGARRFPAPIWEEQRILNILERSVQREKRLEFLINKRNETASGGQVVRYTTDIAELYFELGQKRKGYREMRLAFEQADNDSDLTYVYWKVAAIYNEVLMRPKEALKYELKWEGIVIGSDKIPRLIKIAILYAMCGNRRKAHIYYNEYVKAIEQHYGSLKQYYAQPLSLKMRLRRLGELYYYLGDADNLRKCMEKMERVKPCDTCSFCKCYELLLIKGYLSELEGDYEGALRYLEEANEAYDYGAYTDNIVKHWCKTHNKPNKG